MTGFEEYGGPPLLEVDGGRMLIPFVKAICVDIRPGERLIRVELPEGLEDSRRERMKFHLLTIFPEFFEGRSGMAWWRARRSTGALEIQLTICATGRTICTAPWTTGRSAAAKACC